jgi:hypothetical protein
MAFFQRVVNGGGSVKREEGGGRGALDLLIEWRDARYAIETKLCCEIEAFEQLARYLDCAGLAEGWLVLFDLRSTLPWAQCLTTRAVEIGGHRANVIGC